MASRDAKNQGSAEHQNINISTTVGQGQVQNHAPSIPMVIHETKRKTQCSASSVRRLYPGFVLSSKGATLR